MNGDQAVKWSAVAVVVAVAAIAAVVSYNHALALVLAHGEGGIVARLVPLTVDGLIYAASMALLSAARQKRSGHPLAYGLLGLGIAATLCANVAHGLAHGAIGGIVAAWPAVALVGSYELLMLIIRSAGASQPAGVPVLDTPVPAASNGHDPAAREFADDLARGEVPGIRRIRQQMRVGQPRAQEIRDRLQALVQK